MYSSLLLTVLPKEILMCECVSDEDPELLIFSFDMKPIR